MASDKLKVMRKERWKRRFYRFIGFIALSEAFAIFGILKYYGAI